MEYRYKVLRGRPPDLPPMPGHTPAPTWPPLPLGWQLWLTPPVVRTYPGYDTPPIYAPPVPQRA